MCTEKKSEKKYTKQVKNVIAFLKQQYQYQHHQHLLCKLLENANGCNNDNDDDQKKNICKSALFLSFFSRVALVLNKCVVIIIIISMQFMFDEFPKWKASICVCHGNCSFNEFTANKIVNSVFRCRPICSHRFKWQAFFYSDCNQSDILV